jgi:hypothetical protein
MEASQLENSIWKAEFINWWFEFFNKNNIKNNQAIFRSMLFSKSSLMDVIAKSTTLFDGSMLL